MAPHNAESQNYAWRHIALGDVGSTNDHLRDLARAGDTGDLWVTAERQLQGKGRRGRHWVSEKGNLYTSLLLINPAPLPLLSTMPLLAATALYDAVLQCAPQVQDLAIKWPNDLLLQGHKVAGILLESQMIGDQLALIIGMGVNLSHAPKDTPYPATSFQAKGYDITVHDLFPALQQQVALRLTEWNKGQNAAGIVDAWRARSKGMGQAITVHLNDRTIEGQFVDIDATGQLMLQKANKSTISISTGDVFFKNPV